jgi:MoxR-like ATPase
MLKVNVEYSDKNSEMEMYKKLNNSFDDIKINKILNKKNILEIQKTLEKIHISDNIFTYVSDLVDSTRNPENYNLSDIKKYLSY